jgi:AAA+ ATPase superfamily predicted ATPase
VFIGRKQELAFVNDKYTSPEGQLIVLYGRRRVGKTEFLRRFCEDKPHMFFSCREVSDYEQLSDFSKQLSQLGSPALRYVSKFEGWQSAFEALLELPGDKKLVVIDEFPYMCKGNPSIPSILQHLWDYKLRHEEIMLVLCGSSMEFMEKKILSAKNPLYGRATGIYKMMPLSFDDAIQFFPHYSAEDKLLAYSILGGIPHYLRQFDPLRTLEENLLHNALTKGTVLYNEVEFLMRQELREPAMYNTIISAVALGNTRLNDIYTKTQIEKAKISVYLKNLMELHILTREFSVLSPTKEQAISGRGLYRIADNLFRFWYRFVFAFLSKIETGASSEVLEMGIKPQLNHFASATFEDVCLWFLQKKGSAKELPMMIMKIGRWWDKTAEIDLVAVDYESENYLFAECKFSNTPVDMGVLVQLQEKSQTFQVPGKKYFALFSKSDFTPPLQKHAEENPNILLFTLADVVGLLG